MKMKGIEAEAQTSSDRKFAEIYTCAARDNTSSKNPDSKNYKK